jgi:two-component system, OmpR family, phosphate regulon sensor histidine kinase PhoR
VRSRGLILTTSALAGMPVLALLLLAATGEAKLVPALLAIALTVLAAVCLALIWARDLELLLETVRHAVAAEPAPPTGTPVLPPMDRLMRDIERVARHLADRSVLVERLQRADEAIVEQLPDPLIVLGADRSIRRTNAAARAAFGADISAVLRNPGLRAAIDRAFTSPGIAGPHTAALTLPVPVPRDVHAVVIAMDPPLSDGGRAVVLLSDRTRERALERMRADFVANASHELRTPLASMIGFVDTLLGPAADDPPAQRRFLGIMAEQGARMNRLIDDLLSLSRIELVEHQAPSAAVDLGAVLTDTAASFEPRQAERSVTINLKLHPDLKPVLGDADQLYQVVQNLIDNAIKYGREGGTVRVEAAPALAGNRFPSRPGMLLTVADQGTGIAREHLPRLTERFYRVDKGRSRNVGGTGLGLAIVKHIVNRHRGQLRIDSEAGKGTTISIWLPQAP